MKKLLLFTALASFTFASAQVTTNAGTFNKPAEGDTAFEMQFMPNLDGAAMFADAGATVTMRKFESATKAVRWSASLDVNGSDVEDSDAVFTLGAGVFLGADYYIMPKVYVGVEMGYGLSISSGSDLMTYGLSGGVNGMMRVGFRL